jgi:hypothetical protein
MIVPCARLWPDKADRTLGQNHWSLLAGKLGASFDPVLPRPFLIGLRGAELGADETHPMRHRPAYDDTAVLLIRGFLPYIYPYSSHAYQLDSKLSPDVDGDGRGDVGSVRPGRYVLRRALLKPHPIFTVETTSGSSRIPVHRDTGKHDGVISPEEAKASEERRKGNQVDQGGDYATAVLWHTGYDAPANAAHRSSIACATSSLKWLEIMAEHPVIDYALINAWDALALLPDDSGESEPPPAGVA